MTDTQKDSPWWETLAVFDLETTGIDVTTSRIVSANISVLGPDGTVLERQDWLANPGIEIPAQASAVHGITTERAVADGRPAPEVVAEIVSAIRSVLERGLALTVYNAPYDLTLLRYEAERHGIAAVQGPSPIIDPLVIDRAVDKYRKGKRTLEAAATFYGVELSDAHDAGADAIAAGRVAQAMAHRYGPQIGIAGALLHEKQVQWSNEQSASFAEYMRRTHNPSFVETPGWPER